MAGPEVWRGRGPVADGAEKGSPGPGTGPEVAAATSPVGERWPTGLPGAWCTPLGLGGEAGGAGLAASGRWGVIRGCGAGGGVGRCPCSAGKSVGGAAVRAGACAVASAAQDSWTVRREVRAPGST